MAYRPIWQGHLRLSLVTCQVALYPAVDTADEVHFHLINPKTNNRIKMIATDPDSGPVDRSELVKGYEIAKGEYVLLSSEEIASVRVDSSKTIDIERFVPEDEIDRLYWDHPYFLAPDGKLALETFAVIRTAMEASGKIAIGRVVIGARERILALETRGVGVIAYTLRTDAEVRKPDEIFDGISAKTADREMIAIAGKIIEQKAGPFDPARFVDRYEAALKGLIQAKRKGRKPAKVAEPQDTNVVDLMAALRASLAAKGETPVKPRSRAKSSKTAPPKGKTRKTG